MKLTYTQVQEALAKKPESRYKYFIKMIMAEEEVWGLSDGEGWLMLEDDDGADVIALFPHDAFAKLFKEKGEYEEFEPEALDLYEFMEWLDDFETENIKVGVFPTPDFQCAVLPPGRLKADIQAEFDKEKGE